MRRRPLVVGFAAVCLLALLGGLYLNRSRFRGGSPLGPSDATGSVSVTVTQIAAEPTELPSPRISHAPTAVRTLVANPRNTQSIAVTCGGAEARLIQASAQLERQGAPDSTPERIETVPEPTSSTPSGANEKAATVIIIGPVLGSMDASDVKTDLSCTPQGIALTATITRSADYNGSTLANVLWRPRIELSVVFHSSPLVFQAIWKMRLTTGAEVDHARTPPYPEKSYPITLSTTLT